MQPRISVDAIRWPAPFIVHEWSQIHRFCCLISERTDHESGASRDSLDDSSYPTLPRDTTDVPTERVAARTV